MTSWYSLLGNSLRLVTNCGNFLVLLIPKINKGHGKTFQLLTWHFYIPEYGFALSC